MKDAISNVNDGDIIKLSGNVVATETDTGINIPSKSFTLDLNGYKIDRNLTSATADGYVFWISSGVITANLTIIDSSVAKTGIITGGYTIGYGGAIGVEGATLKLLGGTITGNKTEGYGGGIFADCENATLILGGTAKVVDNTAKETGETEVPSNIHLKNNKVDHFEVGTGDEALVQGTAKIGIRFWLGLEAAIPDTICDIPDEATANCFEADNVGYSAWAVNTSGNYKLVIKSHDHNYNGDTSCQATCLICGKRIENGTHSFNSDKCDATCIGCGKRIENGAHTWSTEDCSAVCTVCGAYKVSGHSFDANGDCTVCGIKHVTEVSDGVYTDNQGLKYSLVKGEMQVGINDAYLSDHTELNVILPKKIVAGESTYGNLAIKIGESANCAKLKSIVLPEGITNISYRAFEGCTGLTSITLPDTVTQIDGYAFAGCSNLQNISLPEGLITIGFFAFKDCVAIKLIEIPDTVIEIGDNAFYNCDSLESVTIPKDVTIIKEGTFEYCSALKSIVIPDTVTEIGGNAFYECNLLENVIIPDTVTEIGGSAFYGCWSLKSVIIPEGVTYIGKLAFHGCRSLAKATIPASVETVEGVQFTKCSAENLVLDIACTPTLRAVTDWGNYKTINWIHDYEGQPYVPDADGINHHQKCKNCDATSASGNHDFSKYVSNGDGTHKVVCKDCDTLLTGHASDACSGGTATCKAKAKCSKCGEEYGSLAAHTYATKWSADATNHWHACTVCGAKKDNGAHVDSDKNEKCDICSSDMYFYVDPTTRIVIEAGVKNIPTSLVEKGLDTEEKISEKMFRMVAQKTEGYTSGKTKIMDVVFQMSTDGGNTWVKVTPDNFPSEGLVVTIPYPEGTNADDYDFVVTHMVTVSLNGLNPGDVEMPAVTKTAKGIQFTVKSLSPIGVSWKALEGSTDPSNPMDPSNEDVETGEVDNRVWLIALLVSLGTFTSLVLSKRKRKEA